MIGEIDPDTLPLYDELDKLDDDELIMLCDFIIAMMKDRGITNE